MQMRQFGRNGPRISAVGYGAWEAGGHGWGADPGEERIKNAIAAALDSGMNWIDTAEAYGNGRSEELIGEVVARRSREDVLIFTKVAHFISGSSPKEIQRAIRGSLKRLGTDYVDLYQIHWPDPKVPVEEMWQTMADLQDEGLTRWIGVSNFERDLLERCLPIRHVDSVQNQFSLLAQWDRRELLPWLAERGIGYLAYGPLTYGLLTGALDRQTTFERSDWRSGSQNIGYYDLFFAPGVFEQNIDKVDRLKKVAERVDASVATVALRAALEVHGVTGVIAGSTNSDHVRSNAEAGDLVLDRETLEEIDEIFRTEPAPSREEDES